MIKNVLAIFLGGGIGSSLRYIVGYYTANMTKNNFPIITLSINVLACFIIGCCYTIFLDKPQISPAIKLALIVGFCGGFSTYSAYSMEILDMFKTSQFLEATLYTVMTLVLGISASWIGVHFAKLL